MNFNFGKKKKNQMAIRSYLNIICNLVCLCEETTDLIRIALNVFSRREANHQFL